MAPFFIVNLKETMAVSFSIDFKINDYKILDEKSNLLLIGSCFTEHIGNKLNNSGFEIINNPFGILFNPISISNAILKIAENKPYKKSDLIRNHEGRYVSFDHHGKYSGIDSDQVILEINKSLKMAHESLKNVDCVIITLGSAWIYKYIKRNYVVANCHKIDNKEFDKELLEVDNVVNKIQEAIDAIKKCNPKANIILTISPVKHLRDGVVENQQSKATLILAVKKLMLPNDSQLFYFPAYEIVTDELRDYRFFESDNSHPNLLAIDYVWKRFKETFFNSKAIQKLIDAEYINKGLAHTSLHSQNANENLQKRIKSYLEKFPLT